MSRKEIIALVLIGVFLLIGFFVYKAYAGEDYMPEDGNWVGKPNVLPPHPEKDKAEKQRVQAFCWSYIKGLRTLYIDISNNGLEQTIAKHPPRDEGVSLEYAKKLGAEIEDVIASEKSPATWLDGKWNACLANPTGVGK